MTIYKFSVLVDNQHLAFDPGADVLNFDSTSIGANAVTLTAVGGNLRFNVGTKSIFLDGLRLEALGIGCVRFANGSSLVLGDGTAANRHDFYGQSFDYAAKTVAVQVWGLGGVDIVGTGSSADVLVGNGPLTSLNHVSRVGSMGSPNSSTSPTVSADGRYVGFAGGWTQFGSASNSGTDVFVKDMSTGAVSNEHKDAAGVIGGSGSGAPVISADGRWLVFESSSALVPGTPPSGMLYRADLKGPGVQAVSTTSGNAAYADRASNLADISADGRYVVFSSAATNLAAGSTSATTDVFLKDMSSRSVTRVSTSTTGGDGNGDSGYLGNAAYTGAKISADGRYVVFQSEASNLTAGDNNGYADIFLWDRTTGGLSNITKGLIAVSNPNNANTRPDVAFDTGKGGYVVFETARNLVAADTSNGTDIYRYNIANGSIQLVSSSAAGVIGNLSSGNASISGDGRFVVFTSYANNLVAGDGNGVADVFVKDMKTGAIALVSKATGGAAGNAASGDGQISLGGDWIVFQSSASNLAATDDNAGFPDVFRISNTLLRDTLSGGAGNDIYVVDRSDLIVEGANAGIDTVRSSISWTLGANLENLVLTGTANINGAGNALNNVITGNAGNNRLDGGAGVDTVSYANATGPVIVDLALTTAQTTGFGSDKLTNFENIIGSVFNDRLTGNALNNRLDGGLGIDTLTGGTGNDTYVVNSSADIVVEAGTATTEIDTVVSAVSWTLGARLENLTLTGTAAINGGGNSLDNRITGNDMANLLSGASGDDTLSAAAGNDTLAGGAGSDRLTGGAGNDFFTLNSLIGSDLITDFVQGSDHVRVSMASVRVGDGDTLVEGRVAVSSANSFAPSAELVGYAPAVSALTPAAAAAALGSATSTYAAGAKVLFQLTTGSSSGLFLFTSSGADAIVSAEELSLLVTVQGLPSLLGNSANIEFGL